MLSEAKNLGPVTLPSLANREPIRIMMMPFILGDTGSLPASLDAWKPTLAGMMKRGPEGVGYLTIDEAVVQAGTTHRRPGAHVDGFGPWGGGGGYGANGMLMVSSRVGCGVYQGHFSEEPGPEGDCSHFALGAAEVMQPGELWWCGAMAVHESIAQEETGIRQFCRISFPSTCPWHEGYTPNPLGILPTGPIEPRRKQMDYRK